MQPPYNQQKPQKTKENTKKSVNEPSKKLHKIETHFNHRKLCTFADGEFLFVLLRQAMFHFPAT